MISPKCSEQEHLDYAEYLQNIREQKAVQDYVLHRPLQRPKTNWVVIACSLLAYLIICIILALVIDLATDAIPTVVRQLLKPLAYTSVAMVGARWFAIKLIECYQHYASEKMRRNCLCMPTCSEYAIAVFRKYCLFVALHKVRIRLFKTCQMGIYKIDLP